MNELNELFEQILHSERKYKVKANKLKELNSSIRQSQLEVQQIRELISNKQGELVVKNLKLSDVEVDAKLLTVRERILLEQRDILALNQRQLQQDLDTKNIELEEKRLCFQKEMCHFSRCYDLHGSGYKYREEETKRHICIRKDELLLLETELTEMDIQREEVKKLDQELYRVQACLTEEKVIEQELKKTKQSCDDDVKCLDEEKVAYKSKLTKEPEFIRLQRELEACKESPEELECHSLSQELEKLQKKCYHKQMKQQLSLQQRNSRKSSIVGEKNSSTQRGHYNPYTHQFVPAPSSSNVGLPSSKFNVKDDRKRNSEQSGINEVELTTKKNLDKWKAGDWAAGNIGREQKRPETRYPGSNDSSLNEDMLLVDSEWLTDHSDVEGDMKCDEWAMDFDESELVSFDENDLRSKDDGSATTVNVVVEHVVSKGGFLSTCNSKMASSKRSCPVPNFVPQDMSRIPYAGDNPKQHRFQPASVAGMSALKTHDEKHKPCARKCAKKVRFHY